jgi:general secretion pathway protein C
MAIAMSSAGFLFARLLRACGRVPRCGVLHLVELFLVIALAVKVAALVWHLVPSAPPSGAERKAGTLVMSAPLPVSQPSLGANEEIARLFGTPHAGAPAVAEAQPQRETPLDLTLKGVLARRDGGQQFALIAQGKTPEQVYSPGDFVAGAEILRVEPRRVVLRRNGVTESLTLEVELLERIAQDDDLDANGASRLRVLDRLSLEREIDDLPKLMRQARAVPHSANGSPSGLRVTHVEQGSFLHDLGIRAEDVIRNVNGMPVRTLAEAREAYEGFRNAETFVIGVLRNDREITLQYSIQ